LVAAGISTAISGCRGGEWVTVSPDWGLVDARTGSIVDPPALVSGEDIEMTEWELQSFAVQVVRDQLVNEGRQLMSWSDNPEVNPSLWFVGDAGPEWVVIRAARFPEGEAPRPANFATIQQTFKARGFKGHFASMAFADSRQADASSAEPIPLYRGYGMFVAYGGLERGEVA
jgi:hypothetical protein